MLCYYNIRKKQENKKVCYNNGGGRNLSHCLYKEVIVIVNNITITNVQTSETIELNKDGSSVFVLDSIDWDSPNVESETYRVPYQIGETQAGVIVGTRKPLITGYIISDDFDNKGMTWKQYEQEQIKSIERTKKQLNKLISIYQKVRIRAGEYYLDAIPTQPVKYSTKESENNEVICYFMINLECFENPLFYKETKVVQLASISGAFHFPLIIPQTGIILGEIQKRASVEIVNDGEAPTGCKIIIRANGGSVVNPSVYNVNTGDFIGFDGGEIYDGDYVTITTETNEENIVYHSKDYQLDVSVVGFLKTGSKFLKIEQGLNYYSYDVDEESINNIEVTIEYEERFFNIEDM